MINSIDSKKLVDLVTANELKQMADYLVAEVKRLASAGAGSALIAANTPHLVFDEVQRRSPIPMLSIVTATRDVAADAGLRRPALFGTRFTMKATFFPEIFKDRQIAIVVPNEAEQAYIHDKYMSELFVGTDSARDAGAIARDCAGNERSRKRGRIDSRRHGVVVNPARDDGCGAAGAGYNADSCRSRGQMAIAKLEPGSNGLGRFAYWPFRE